MRTVGFILLLLVILLVAGFVVYRNNSRVAAAKAKYESDIAAQGEYNVWAQLQDAYGNANATPCNPLAPWNESDAKRGCYGKEQFNLGRYLNSFFGIG